MTGTGKNSTGFGGRLTGVILSGALLLASAVSWGAGPVQHSSVGLHAQYAAAQHQASPSAKPSPAHPVQQQPEYRPAPQPAYRPPAPPAYHPPTQPAYRPPTEPGPALHPATRTEPPRPGQEHLPAWWAQHRTLSPQQQADALRREPGFRSLPDDQQQRLINRLHNFNQRPPEQQQRMLGRVEMFEHLPPERQQEVRGASQALGHMPPDRQAVIRHAFQQLRAMPPDERQRVLNSTYGSQFSPQERTVLGNLLSIEPYQGKVITPYFGR